MRGTMLTYLSSRRGRQFLLKLVRHFLFRRLHQFVSLEVQPHSREDVLPHLLVHSRSQTAAQGTHHLTWAQHHTSYTPAPRRRHRAPTTSPEHNITPHTLPLPDGDTGHPPPHLSTTSHLIHSRSQTATQGTHHLTWAQHHTSYTHAPRRRHRAPTRPHLSTTISEWCN